MKSSDSDPKTESFKIVKETLLKDVLLAPKLEFFISLSKHVEPYLTEYQTDAPMLQFAHHDLNAIAIGLLKRFVIPEKIEEIKTTKDIVSFQVTDPLNHVTRHKIAVGFVADSMIYELKKAKKVSELQILEIKDACKSILVCFADKFLTKSPLHYGLVKDMACLDPAAILESKVKHKQRLN
ncbi:hypothetical protein ACJMK2_009935 [Sinanodonta woodiana]|uniref:Uncharacterized protein n=1 Tax=Sinanodonta woodiana TaxID=1069815 RepID=A0ABD3VDV3_SINWO